jgi:poly(A) polymerase
MAKNGKLALEIVRTLRQNGFQAYFAGGCVRDMVMKKTPSDYDVATDAQPRQIKKLFKKTVFVGAAFGTALVILDGVSFEVTTFRGGTRNGFSKDAATDAANRDFTINSLFYDPLGKKVIDFFGGRADIKKRLIRCVSTPAVCFRADRLRLLRAARLSAGLGFKIDHRAFEVIKKMAAAIRKVSAERVRDELVSLMAGPDPYSGMRLLDESGLLGILLPEITGLKGVEQPPKFHPEGDVFVHTMLLIKQLKKADAVLAFACLLHDVGKPATFKKTDRIRFNGHDRVGARIAEGILKRLKFSNEEIRKITYCIDNHMRIMNAMKMRESTLKRMFLKDTFETELSLHKYDCIASHADLKIYRFLKKKYAAFRRKPVLPKPLLNGHELIAMGLKEGPLIGRIHRKMVDLQFEGKLSSEEGARRWVREKYL